MWCVYVLHWILELSSILYWSWVLRRTRPATNGGEISSCWQHNLPNCGRAGRRRQTQESARAPERHNAEPAGRAQGLDTTGVQRSPPPLIKCPEAVSRGEQLSTESSLQFALRILWIVFTQWHLPPLPEFSRKSNTYKGIGDVVHVFGHDQKHLHRAETLPKFKHNDFAHALLLTGRQMYSRDTLPKFKQWST